MDLVMDDRHPMPMALLRSGVPLSLLLDLAYGPDSAHVLRSEPLRQPATTARSNAFRSAAPTGPTSFA